MSLLLLVGAGLFARTLTNLESVELGFDPDHLLLFDVNAAPASCVARPVIRSSPPAVSVIATTGAMSPGAGIASEAKKCSVPEMSPSLSSPCSRNVTPTAMRSASRPALGEVVGFRSLMCAFRRVFGQG